MDARGGMSVEIYMQHLMYGVGRDNDNGAVVPLGMDMLELASTPFVPFFSLTTQAAGLELGFNHLLLLDESARPVFSSGRGHACSRERSAVSN